MNESHLEFLASDQWADMLRTDLLPWVERVGDLGQHVLEIGPGPGRTTDLLRERAQHVTAVEMDEGLAEELRARLAGTNVEVVTGDGTDSGFGADVFSTVTAFSVLHHMPSPEAQDRLFAELSRVLRPGGVFVGSDARDTERMRIAHVGDTFVPVDPDALPDRLRAAGFTGVEVDMTDLHIRFVARKPAGAAGP
jgi:SAM-dependent methyltransferase